MKHFRFTAIFFWFILISACSTTPVSHTPANTSTPTTLSTKTPTSTPTLTPTATPVPIKAEIYPNIEQAREEGFHLLAGHPPFSVDFHAEASGGTGELSFYWDFDGDGIIDSTQIDPDQFTYEMPGEFLTSVTVRDEFEQEETKEQRIVVIGEPYFPDWKYGVCAQLDWVPGFYEDFDEVEKAAQMISELGVDVVRTGMNWPSVQLTKSSDYNWETYDFLIELSRKYNYDVLFLLSNSAQWASSKSQETEWEEWGLAYPSDLNEHAWFFYNAVSRYKEDVHAWIVWNEPNNSFFWRSEPDPIYYTELLRTSYLAIKYADPKAVVVLAGLAGGPEDAKGIPYIFHSPEKYLQAIYDSGGGKYFDVVNRHPYTDPYLGTSRIEDRLESIRMVMVENGDEEKPIWLAEYGWPANASSGLSDYSIGWWLNTSFTYFDTVEYLDVVFWFVFRDQGNDPYIAEHGMGLIEYDWDIKPAYEAYKEYIIEHPKP